MRARLAVIIAAVAVLSTIALTPALAGSPHFVGTPTATRDGDALTVAGKVAGLGNETQIHVVVTADVQCVNPGNNEPQATNKGAVIAEGDAPVMNGKALFSVTGTGVTDPDCSPPMRLDYSNVVVTVSGASFADLAFAFPGVL